MTTNVPPTAAAGAAQDVNGGDTVILMVRGASTLKGPSPRTSGSSSLIFRSK
jgi:hypothetical protein